MDNPTVSEAVQPESLLPGPGEVCVSMYTRTNRRWPVFIGLFLFFSSKAKWFLTVLSVASQTLWMVVTQKKRTVTEQELWLILFVAGRPRQPELLEWAGSVAVPSPMKGLQARAVAGLPGIKLMAGGQPPRVTAPWRRPPRGLNKWGAVAPPEFDSCWQPPWGLVLAIVISLRAGIGLLAW